MCALARVQCRFLKGHHKWASAEQFAQSLRLASSGSGNSFHEEQERLSLEKKAKQKERLVLLEEAAFLTRALYRVCLRSIRVIRWGNEVDEKEFEQREEEFRSQKPGIMSMAPPPNREE